METEERYGWGAMLARQQTHKTAGSRMPRGNPAVAVEQRLHLLDLQEVELYGRLTAKEGDQHRDFVALGVNLADGADELGKGAVNDLDGLADGVVDLRLRLGRLAGLGGRAQDV